MTVWAVADEYSKPMEEEKRRLSDHFLNSYDEIRLEG